MSRRIGVEFGGGHKVNDLNSEIEIKPGKITRVYSKEETLDIEQKWIKTFCKNKQGANIKAYRWHIFSFERYPSLSGERAIEKYTAQKANEYIILPNDGELAIETDSLPECCNIMDYLVFPKNMAWIMAFTHEDGWLGPYFAEHKNYEKLNSQNEQKLKMNEKKQKEIENAKNKGWI